MKRIIPALLLILIAASFSLFACNNELSLKTPTLSTTKVVEDTIPIWSDTLNIRLTGESAIR